MCGVAGFIGQADPQLIRDAIGRMVTSLAHRGPDDEGIALHRVGDSVLALGHRRLAILDLSEQARQPMTNPETGDVIVYNGEVYNFVELRHELQSQGHIFRTSSDTEVILHAYQSWGMEFVKKLRGMFALGIWDARKHQLVLARDPLGIKPLYFVEAPGWLLFSSEVRALLASGMVGRQVDPRGLASFLAYGAVQEPLAAIKGVRLLPAGSVLVTSALGRVQARKRYWTFPKPETSPAVRNSEELIEAGRELFKCVVSRHLRSDVPVSVFLSSGLDSTAIAGVAKAIAGENLTAFTVSFPEVPYHDEAEVAARTCSRLGLRHVICPIDSRTAFDWAVAAAERLDQPTVDGVNTYMVSKAVRQFGLKVALSGQGGDEVFGGYVTFKGIPRWYKRALFLNLIPGPIRRSLLAVATRNKSFLSQERIKDLAFAGHDMRSVYFYYQRLLPDHFLRQLGLQAKELGLTPSFHDPDTDTEDCVVEGDPVATVSRLELRFYLGSTLLRDADVFGMANSLEIRVPMLDLDLVEWVLRLPGSVVLPSGLPDKYLLRKIGAEFYDEEQLAREKRGFAAPFWLWIREPLREFVEQGLGEVKRSGVVRSEGVDCVYKRFSTANDKASWAPIWALAALGFWLRRTVGSPS